MKDYFSPGDVITPAPDCDWFETPHPLLLVVSAAPFRGDSRAPGHRLGWWQVTTTPPLTSLSTTDSDLRRGLILDVEWTIINHHEETTPPR